MSKPTSTAYVPEKYTYQAAKEYDYALLKLQKPINIKKELEKDYFIELSGNSLGKLLSQSKEAKVAIYGGAFDTDRKLYVKDEEGLENLRLWGRNEPV